MRTADIPMHFQRVWLSSHACRVLRFRRDKSRQVQEPRRNCRTADSVQRSLEQMSNAHWVSEHHDISCHTSRAREIIRIVEAPEGVACWESIDSLTQTLRHDLEIVGGGYSRTKRALLPNSDVTEEPLRVK